MNDMARVIGSGDLQTVELPEGRWFDTEEVFVRREGSRVVLETAADAIDLQTGLTIARLRELIQEGLDSGPSEPWSLEELLQKAHRRHP